jgi:RHS repeat-associated protein
MKKNDLNLYKDNYPFVMEMVKWNPNWYLNSDNLYLYNGIELQTNFNLNWCDYGHRFYDPQVVRMTTIDPLAEGFEILTPSDNPIKNIDLDGLEGLAPGMAGDFGTGYLMAKAQMGTLQDRDLAIARQVTNAEVAGTLVGFATIVAI